MPGEDRDFVIRRAKEMDVKFIRLWFTDILGSLKSFAITVEELEKALTEGMTFDGASIEGFARDVEQDMVAVPDPSTFVLLPWRPREQNAVARMFCDIYTPDGKPFIGDPRYVLRRNLDLAREMGFTYYVGPEIEHFYFQSGEGTPVPLDHGGYFDLTPLDVASDLRRETVLELEEMGIGVEFSHHEAAYSQHEIDLRYTDALTMADNIMTYRLVVKEVALRHNVYASFMPKPLAGLNGSGLHLYLSLFSKGENVFSSKDLKDNLSPIGRHFIAGLLEHAPAITAVTNQWVNSYKRLVPGFEAPVYLSWALKNRSDLVRVPEYKVEKADSARVEYRAPDPACNPYLAFSVILAAGLDGVSRKLSPPEPVVTNLAHMTPQERAEMGIGVLPTSLEVALTNMKESSLVREALGDHVFESFLRNKGIEWESYRSQVTDYELKRYLPIL